MYKRINLRPEKLKQFTRHKHPWIFSGAILGKHSINDGDLVAVYCDNLFIGNGYYNSASQIAIRLISWKENEIIDQNFLSEKITSAIRLRYQLLENQKTSAYRIIFAESDFLPGFIVDKYNNSLILQIHTLGAEKLKTVFVAALIESYQSIYGQSPEMIYEKSEIKARRHEGLTEVHQELLFGKLIKQETILENNLKFEVNFFDSQKTGFFIDQRVSRQIIEKYSKSKKVLNLFAYTGGFSLYAARGEASKVVSLDISKPAVDQINQNFQINKLKSDHLEIVDDAFDYLTDLEPNQFDLIILDPPAFIKSRQKIQEGIRGYLTINQKALEKLPENGLILTCSCSGALSDEDFFRMLNWAANAANCQIQVVEKISQPLDHPLTPFFPEGAYLKSYLIRKVLL
ncbi:class I SAM-dependent rRNA methyltransferase [Candidatus Peregrinibacteria bacterium]|nr:class I SAM-dependent rRNA methyltransferase [Candidatus Peregrinibacteria bacterium]